MTAEAVAASLEPLRRAGPGRLVISGDGAPRQRRRVIPDVLAPAAAPRIQGARLPACAPDLKPGAGLWGPLTGVDRRHVGGGPIRPGRRERPAAVPRVRRTPRMIRGCFAGAQLSFSMFWSVGGCITVGGQKTHPTLG